MADNYSSDEDIDLAVAGRGQKKARQVKHLISSHIMS